jgi:tetratricopeptide (TPR) repeat protein
MRNKKDSQPVDRAERRENAMRPSSFLGYDRDEIGEHLMGREAFEIAESQFRRAVWLNPFEPLFKEHLAWSLFQQHRYAEALPIIEAALAQRSNSQTSIVFKRVIVERIENHGSAERPTDPST